MKKYIPVVLLLAAFFILVFTSVSTKSPVCDASGHHIGTGYSFVRTEGYVQRLLMRLSTRKLCQELEQDVLMRERVDRLLEKISKEGMASLTRKEMKFLNQASKLYRQQSRS